MAADFQQRWLKSTKTGSSNKNTWTKWITVISRLLNQVAKSFGTLPMLDYFTAPGIQRKHKYNNSISHIFLSVLSNMARSSQVPLVLPSVFFHWSYHMSRRQSWQPTAISSYLRTEARFRTMKLRIRRPGESILGKQTLKTIQNGYNVTEKESQWAKHEFEIPTQSPE